MDELVKECDDWMSQDLYVHEKMSLAKKALLADKYGVKFHELLQSVHDQLGHPDILKDVIWSPEYQEFSDNFKEGLLIRMAEDHNQITCAACRHSVTVHRNDEINFCPQCANPLN